MKRCLLVLAASVFLSASAAWANPVAPVVSDSAAASSPVDPSTNPVLGSLQKAGAKFFFLGKQAGLNGWLIIKNGQVQMAYATPDNKSALVGALFGENGENVSAKQVETLAENNEEVRDLFAAIQKEQAALSQVGSPPAQPVERKPVAGLPSAPLSPGDRLIQDLSGATSVVVGKPNAPEILMVMDPNCPHCQETWKGLREAVVKGFVHLRMIPIAQMDTDLERAAAVFLTKAEPMIAWDRYVSGDASALGGTPASEAFLAVRANAKLVASWKITSTPYLVYRAKDDKVKVVKGRPDDLNAIFRDLGM